MTLSKSFIRNAAMAPLDARLMNMAGLAADSTGAPRTGVLGNNPSIVSALGTMNVAVNLAEFATSKGRADGVAIFANDGVVNVPIAAAPVSNSRYTVVWVKHEDNTTGDAASLPIFGTTDGAAAASPIEPTVLPTGAEKLATLRIFTGTTATNGGANTLVNNYRMTAARGATVHVRNAAELALYTPADGNQAWQIDTSTLWTRSGGAWEGGWVTYAPVLTTSGGATSGNSTISGRYRKIGKTVDVQINFQLGSTYAGPAGSWRFSLPFAPTAGVRMGIPAGVESAGVGFFYGGGYIENNSYIEQVGSSAAAGAILPSSPSLAANSKVWLRGNYEIA